MFEFFIALFGGLFYGKKYSNEKSKLKAYDERRAMRPPKHRISYCTDKLRYISA